MLAWAVGGDCGVLGVEGAGAALVASAGPGAAPPVPPASVPSTVAGPGPGPFRSASPAMCVPAARRRLDVGDWWPLARGAGGAGCCGDATRPPRGVAGAFPGSGIFDYNTGRGP